MIKVLILLLFSSYQLFAKEDIFNFYKRHWKLPSRAYKSVISENILVDSEVSSNKSKQIFKLKTLGHHPKNCKKALRVISNFERYPKLISYIKKAQYNEKAKLLTIHARHMLLPFPMIVHVLVQRPTKPGVYPFSFPTGIFQGLKGKLIIKELSNTCNAYAESYWEGKPTKIPNLVVEIFSETLMKIASNILIRKSSI